MKKAEKKTLVYCGPDIPRVVKQYSVFTDGLPDRLTQIADEIPSIRALIVPVKDVAATRIELQTQGSAKHNIFMKAKKEIEKGVW
ncbi:MAG: hypothetical protein IJY52_01540 [Anaerotignum sp.]|nr:hypothetical protein [Anaerotignum sp.]